MPRKVRELEGDLKRAGFVRTRAKGSHRKWTHPSGRTVIMAGKEGADAKAYQERDVEEAIAAVGKST